MEEIYNDIRCIQSIYASMYLDYINKRKVGLDCGLLFQNLVQYYLSLDYLLCLEEFLESDLALIKTMKNKC